MTELLRFEPALCRRTDGTPVTTPAEWECRRRELLRILSQEEYGIMPPSPACVRGTVQETVTACCAGHAVLETVALAFDTPGGEFRFPVRFFNPTGPGKHPLFLLLNFRPDAYDRYLPAEEIIDGGFAVATVNYQDITADNGDFTDGIAALYPRHDSGTAWGKIGMWAFGASRMVDYFLTRPEIDAAHIAVIGHSRLGKAALWCGAQDPRVLYVISNDSGCSGAAYERVKHEGAETVDRIVARFPYLFCENYAQYRKVPETRAFDQHFLLALSAPRFVAVGSAEQDHWADPYAEQLSCIGASPAWNFYGVEGYNGKTAPAVAGECLGTGRVRYHIRDGIHYLSRADWQVYMRMIRDAMAQGEN